jgi:hypothetical protein
MKYNGLERANNVRICGGSRTMGLLSVAKYRELPYATNKTCWNVCILGSPVSSAKDHCHRPPFLCQKLPFIVWHFKKYQPMPKQYSLKSL